MNHALTVLYEDETLLAVDKPAGMHTAPLRAAETGTLLDLVICEYPEIARLPGLKTVEPGLLHRLDKDTSGVVMLARTPQSFRALREQFKRETVVKEYRAACGVADRVSVPGRLKVESRFAPAGPGRRKVRVILPADEGRKAAREATRDSYLTEVEVEQRGARGVLIAAVIRRGFRHQVRAHLAHAGLPIFGDPLYGVPAPPGVPQRLYLHASAVLLAHPVSGDRLRILSPLPDAFLDAVR